MACNIGGFSATIPYHGEMRWSGLGWAMICNFWVKYMCIPKWLAKFGGKLLFRCISMERQKKLNIIRLSLDSGWTEQKKFQEKIQPYTKKATKRDGAQNITVRHLDRNSVQRKDMLMCMQQFFAYSILSWVWVELRVWKRLCASLLFCVVSFIE